MNEDGLNTPDSTTESIEKMLDKSGLKLSTTQQGDKIIVPKDGVSTKFDPNEFTHKFLQNTIDTPVSTGEFIQLYEYYLNSVLEKQTKKRFQRYDAMDFILDNDPALSVARRTLVDETMQADLYNEPIKVKARKANVKKKIEKLLNSLGIKNLIRQTVDDIVSYGDGFWILDYKTSEGVKKVIPISPRDVDQRYEFSLVELKKHQNKYKQNLSGLDSLIQLASKIESNASFFNKVLLGFKIHDTVFPFYQVCHFRNYTTKKDIFPFGKPLFHDSQSEARMYLNSKVIVNMIRSSAFMREEIGVQTPEGMDPADQFAMVSTIKNAMENQMTSKGTSNKNVPSFGEKLYYPQGLIDIRKNESGYNFRDRFDDLKILRDDVMTSAGMPRGFFSGDDGGQYQSAKALMLQDKRFARQVYHIQTIITSQIMKLIEVHFNLTGEFDPNTEEYSVALPYPVPVMDYDQLNVAQTKLSYAQSIIDNLKMSLELTKIPKSVVRKVLTSYMDMSHQEVDDVINQMQYDDVEEKEKGIDPHGSKIGDPFLIGKKESEMMDQGVEPPEGTASPTPQTPTSTAQPSSQATPDFPRQPVADSVEYAAYKQFCEKVERVNLDEHIQNSVYKAFVSAQSGAEFVHNGYHYLTNEHADLDDTLSRLLEVEEKELLKGGEKGQGVFDGKEFTLNEHIDPETLNEKVEEDTTPDRRFMSQKEKNSLDIE
jgi:hypothetical protein